MIKGQLFGIATAALLGMGAVAHAASETVSFDITNTQSTGITTPFTLGGFDPSLGTLTGITLTFDLTTETGPVITSTGPGTYSSQSTSFEVTVSGPGASHEFEATSGPMSGSFSRSSTPAETPVETVVPIDVAPADFASYEAGPVTFQLANTEPAIVDGNVNAPGSFSGIYADGSYSGTVSAEYTYTPAELPEPSTYALLLGGLGLLVLFARLRSQQTA